MGVSISNEFCRTISDVKLVELIEQGMDSDKIYSWGWGNVSQISGKRLKFFIIHRVETPQFRTAIGFYFKWMASVSLNETLTIMYILWDRIDFMRFYVCLGNIFFLFKLYISFTEGNNR